MRRSIWLKVTHDKYELPVMVADSAEELAKLLGCSVNNIHASRSHAKKHEGWWTPYRRVEVEEDDEE
jgi:hypothetical protein